MITLIIICITVVMFMITKIPTLITAMFCLFSLTLTGVIDWTTAFSGFSNVAVLTTIGIMMMSGSFFTTGLVDDVGDLLYKFTQKGEKFFVMCLWFISAACGAFISCLPIMVMFMPIIDTIAKRSGGVIRRKMTYCVMAIGMCYGAICSTFAASSIITASGLFAATEGGRTLRPFETLPFGLTVVILGAVFFLTFGYKLMNKVFTFEEPPVEADSIQRISTEGMTEKELKVLKVKKILTGIVFIVCIVCFISGLNMGAVAFLGAFTLIVLGCMDVKSAIQSVDWTLVVLMACCLGFAYAMGSSGCAQMIADFFIRVSGDFGQTPWGQFVVVMFLGTLLSNFMSHNAAVSLVTPIGFALARTSGAPLVAGVVAALVGANLSIATPVCVIIITMSMKAGYNARHILKVNGLLNLLAFIACSIVAKFVYFM